MKNFQGSVALVAIAALLSACSSAGDGADVSAAPHAEVVGRIQIETHEPVAESGSVVSPEPTASVSPGAYVPDVPPEDGLEDTRGPDEYEAAFAAAFDSLCSKAAQWWRSALEVSLDEWKATGLEVYVPSSQFGMYNEEQYASLRSANWDTFDTIVEAAPHRGGGVCAFARPAATNAKLSEMVTLTFSLYSPESEAFPGAFGYKESTSRDAMVQTALSSLH